MSKKLSAAQVTMLEAMGYVAGLQINGKEIAATKRAAKLVETGYAQCAFGKYGFTVYTLTDAGTAYLASLVPAAADTIEDLDAPTDATPAPVVTFCEMCERSFQSDGATYCDKCAPKVAALVSTRDAEIDALKTRVAELEAEQKRLYEAGFVEWRGHECATCGTRWESPKYNSCPRCADDDLPFEEENRNYNTDLGLGR